MMESNNAASILILNNDCLHEIFSYLSLPYLYFAGQVCKRFKDVTRMRYSTMFCDLDELSFQKPLPLPVVEHIAEVVSCDAGPYVTRLSLLSGFKNENGHEVSKRLPLSLLLNYTNLKEIVMRQYALLAEDYDYIDKFAGVFKSIESLQLICCEMSDHVVSKLLSICPKLKDLHVVQYYDNYDIICGDFLTKLRGIERLSLKHCSAKPEYFQQFCEHNPQVVKLELFLTSALNRTCIQIIANTMKNLMELSLTFQYELNAEDYAILGDLQNICKLELKESGITKDLNFDNSYFDLFLKKILQQNSVTELNLDLAAKGTLKDIAKFKNLKCLSLQFIVHNIDDILANLSCCDTLEKLSVKGYKELTVDTLANLIKKCPQLKIINLEWCDVDLELIKKIVPCLNNRHGLILKVHGTPLSNTLKKNPKDDVEKLCAEFSGKITLVLHDPLDFFLNCNDL